VGWRSREWMHGELTASHEGDQCNTQVMWSLGFSPFLGSELEVDMGFGCS